MWLLLVSLVFWLVISTWSPPKSLAWQKGFRLGSGLTLRRLGPLLLVCILLLPVSVVGQQLSGHRRDFILGCPLAAAAILSCKVQSDRWIALHLAVRALFDYGRWNAWVTQPVRCTPLWPASWLPVVDKSRGSKSVEVQRVWEIYNDPLQYMSGQDASLLDQSLDRIDVSLAWSVWSRAAESALVDAFRFSGGPIPSRGLILGRGTALLRSVQLGGPRVRRARANAADAVDAADVFFVSRLFPCSVA